MAQDRPIQPRQYKPFRPPRCPHHQLDPGGIKAAISQNGGMGMAPRANGKKIGDCLTHDVVSTAMLHCNRALMANMHQKINAFFKITKNLSHLYVFRFH
jgi:hypothetical protein